MSINAINFLDSVVYISVGIWEEKDESTEPVTLYPNGTKSWTRFDKRGYVVSISFSPDHGTPTSIIVYPNQTVEIDAQKAILVNGNKVGEVKE